MPPPGQQTVGLNERAACRIPGTASPFVFRGDGIHSSSSQVHAGPGGSAPSSGPLKTLDDAVREHIERALVLTSGRVEGRGGAADVLGLNPHTLRGKMRKLRVDWSRFRQ